MAKKQGALQKRGDTQSEVMALLERRDVQRRLAEVAPQTITPKRLMRMIVHEIKTNGSLRGCDPMTILGAAVEASMLGLEFGGGLGHTYAVPYNMKHRKVCQLIIGYKGYMHLARQSGSVSHFWGSVVHENDDFVEVLGVNERLEHTPAMRNRGKPVAAYAIAFFTDGGRIWRTVREDEIARAKSASASAKSSSSPWSTDTAAMYFKTAVRRLVPLLPLASLDLQRAAAIDDVADERGAQPFAMFDDDALDEYAAETETTTADDVRSRVSQQRDGDAPGDDAETQSDEPATQGDDDESLL